MFHLAQGIYNNWNRKKQYSILILGLDNAGKTTLLETLKQQSNLASKPLDKITPTVGQNITFLPIPGSNGKKTLKLWDVGGQESLRSMWPEYYSQCHGIIFVVDSADRSRIDECKDTLTSIVMDDEVEGLPIIMLANKQDRPDRMEIQDIKQIFNQIAEHLGARDSRVLPISALTGDGVSTALDWLIARLERNKKDRPSVYR